MDLDPSEILFIGLGPAHAAWYRCFQPAIALGCDWVGTIGEPPESLHNIVGSIRGSNEMRDLVATDYKIIVVQQVRGPKWRKWIKDCQAKGIVVIYEIDDDVLSIGYLKGHPNAQPIKAQLENYRMCMRQCDGMICATPFLSHKLSNLNARRWVCPNGLDFERYEPYVKKIYSNQESVTVGFTGGLGHEHTIDAWLPKIKAVTSKLPFLRFVSIGNPIAKSINNGVVRSSTSIQDYPRALAEFDIALAPGGKSDFYRAKGELKWTEAGALGIPTIASPIPSVSMQDKLTGLIVDNPEEFSSALTHMATSAEYRKKIGINAYTWIHNNCGIDLMMENWIQVFEEVTP